MFHKDISASFYCFLDSLIILTPWALFLSISGRVDYLGLGQASSPGPDPEPLRIDAYPNILKISPPKTGRFQTKSTDIFHISVQNIDCGYSLEPPHRGGSNEYLQSMFLSRKMENNVYCKPQFYYLKVGFKGVKII